MEVLQKTENRLSYDPAIPLLGIYPDKTVVQNDTCTAVFIAVLITIAKTWKETKCPSTEEPIKKMYIYTILNAIWLEYYSAIKRNVIG